MPNTDDSLPPTGQTLLRAFESLISILNERKIRYAIIDGLDVIQHTRVRTLRPHLEVGDFVLMKGSTSEA